MTFNGSASGISLARDVQKPVLPVDIRSALLTRIGGMRRTMMTQPVRWTPGAVPSVTRSPVWTAVSLPPFLQETADVGQSCSNLIDVGAFINFMTFEPYCATLVLNAIRMPWLSPSVRQILHQFSLHSSRAVILHDENSSSLDKATIQLNPCATPSPARFEDLRQLALN